MSEIGTEFVPLEALRPQLLALLALHRGAETEAARAVVVSLLERTFLATAWHVAEDLLENGWTPQVVATPARRAGSHLRVVGGADSGEVVAVPGKRRGAGHEQTVA